MLANTRIPAWRMNPKIHCTNANRKHNTPSRNTITGFVSVCIPISLAKASPNLSELFTSCFETSSPAESAPCSTTKLSEVMATYLNAPINSSAAGWPRRDTAITMAVPRMPAIMIKTNTPCNGRCTSTIAVGSRLIESDFTHHVIDVRSMSPAA
jgi:hypothetical protein